MKNTYLSACTIFGLSLAMTVSVCLLTGCDDEDDDEITATTNFTVPRSSDAVDLGLSVKWAPFNVGADAAEDYGNYYAWGEIEPSGNYSEDNCKSYNVERSDINGNAAYDAATANWSSEWRMPTQSEWNELISCTWEWQSDPKGYIVTGTNGNSIFLPVAGYCDGTDYKMKGTDGGYWTSTPIDDDTVNALSVYFDSESTGHIGNRYRYQGRSIRPVLAE